MDLTDTAVLLLISTTLSMAGLAALIRRLFGAQVGTLRIVVAVGVGLFTAARLGAMMPRDRHGELITIQIGAAVLAATAFLLIAEALLPDHLWMIPLRYLRRARRHWVRGRRLSQIGSIAIRRGLGLWIGRARLAHDRRMHLARSLRLAIEDGGVTFIKLGQVPSVRQQLLPADIGAELSLLEDRVTAAPWDDMRPVMEEAWGRSIDELFIDFDREPLAAASIAQVYRATLPCGEEVAIKVQRPGVRDVIERDLEMVRDLAELVQERTKSGRSMQLTELADGFAGALREELDFRTEARNMTAVAALEAADDSVNPMRVPAVRPELSSERVLVMELLDGVPLSRAEAEIAARGLDRKVLARTLLRRVLRQIVVDGLFHADPHPGNILLLANGELAMLDFGCVGRLDGPMKSALQRILLAVEANDPVALCDGLMEALVLPEDLHERRFQRDVGDFMARYLRDGVRVDSTMLTDLLKILARHRLGTPPPLAAVFRSLTTLEGTLAVLSPGFDIVTEAREFALARLANSLRPRRLLESLTAELLPALPALRRIPRRIDQITGALEQGRLTVRVRLFAEPSDRRFIASLVHLVMLGVLGAT
ncbi:MAG TPA: AarF/UbiB family protein, partial [Micromonospora sp.]